MEPRPEGRGETADLVEGRASVNASMEPRPEGRGEGDTVAAGTVAGVSFNGATSRRTWREYRFDHWPS